MAIVDVVKYNGKPDVLAWKYPNEELGTWTQLIVNESQEAILVKSGKVLDVFGSGRHTLDTANIPILNNIVNLPFGGRSPFTAFKILSMASLFLFAPMVYLVSM